MPNQLTRLAAALFAVLNSPTAASFSGDIIIGDLAKQADEASWMDAMAHPNAANAVRIPGYNITTKYSTSPHKSEDWGLLIGVTADIPTREAPGTFFTGTTIRWMPPAALTQGERLAGDTSWTLCMGVYRGANLRTDNEQINSTCEGLLPDKCIQVLQRHASKNNVCSTDFVLPEDCRDGMGGVEEDGYGVQTSFNESIHKSSIGFYYGTEREGHDRGNYTAYDEAIRQVWLVMTGFTNSSSKSTRNSEYHNGSAEGSIRCIRADKFTNGSRTYENASGGQKVLMNVVSVVVSASLFFVIFA